MHLLSCLDLPVKKIFGCGFLLFYATQALVIESDKDLQILNIRQGGVTERSFMLLCFVLFELAHLKFLSHDTSLGNQFSQ